METRSTAPVLCFARWFRASVSVERRRRDSTITPSEVVGRAVHLFREVDSTNEEAKRLAAGSAEGTVVIAETQTRGKGGRGRTWYSPQGGIWLSVVLKPDLPPQDTPVLNLLLSLAVTRALRALGVKAETRWPNDVLIRGKKVAGVLAEADFNSYTNWVVVGVGIDTNVEIESFPEDFRARATSLKRELGREIDNSKLIGHILRELDRDYRRLREGRLHEMLDEWKRHASMMGRRVKIKTKDELLLGIALDIGRDGSLSLKTENGNVRRATAGECSLDE